MSKELVYSASSVICMAAGGGCLAFGRLPAGLALLAAAAVISLLGAHSAAQSRVRLERKLKKTEADCTAMEQHAEEIQEEGRLQQQECMANADEKISDFCSRISHEMRLPISIIAGYADLLYKDIVTEDAIKKEYLKKISERIQYLNDILSRHLSETRDGLSHEQLEKSRFDLIALLHEIVQDVTAAALDKAIELQVVSSVRQLMMIADPTHLTRAFYNIIENAIKYMGRSGTITIKVTMLDPQTVHIIFQDDGMGLSPEETAHIFELNYQGCNHTEGRGHGLYLVRQSVLSHGGTVTARSSEGRGMGIYITLPINGKTEQK